MNPLPGSRRQRLVPLRLCKSRQHGGEDKGGDEQDGDDDGAHFVRGDEPARRDPEEDPDGDDEQDEDEQGDDEGDEHVDALARVVVDLLVGGFGAGFLGFC